MKVLKFRENLVPLVLSGEKSSTWRLFDDKDLGVGDVVELRVFATNERFATAKLTEVVSKPFKDLLDDDREGHESFMNDEDMYATYSQYYNCDVTPKTVVKIIRFVLT